MVVTTFSHSCTNPMIPLSVSAILTGSVSQLMDTSCPYTGNRGIFQLPTFLISFPSLIPHLHRDKTPYFYILLPLFVYVKGVGGKKKNTVNKNTARDLVMSAVFCCCCENGSLHFRW